MQAPEIALTEHRYNFMIIQQQYIAPAQLLVFTGSVFDNSSLFPEKYNPVLETPPYQRYPEDKIQSKLCALDHRQKEVYAKQKKCQIQIQIRSYRTQVVELCCKGSSVFYMSEFAAKIISEDTIITREPQLFLLTTNNEQNQTH